MTLAMSPEGNVSARGGDLPLVPCRHIEDAHAPFVLESIIYLIHFALPFFSNGQHHGLDNRVSADLVMQSRVFSPQHS